MKFLVIIIILLLSCLCVLFVAGEEFPVRIHNSETGAIVDHILRINGDQPNVDWEIVEFCEKNHVLENFCVQLHQTVINRLSKSKSQVVPAAIPNAHLSRFKSAYEAEEKRLLNSEIVFDTHTIQNVEMELVQKIIGTWHDHVPRRLVVIHSCTFNKNNSRILEEILRLSDISGLSESVDSVLVFNYGHAVQADLVSNYSGRTQFFQVDFEVSYFEIPTLRILHTLAKHLHAAGGGDAQLLYLHTKGASYTETYPQIEDWRHLMLHFLVERHQSCFHLLQSGELDCVGVNYKSLPRRIFSGNYWWSLASHLARLPVLQYETSSKYEAEAWLLHRIPARIFVMHNTNLNHAVQTYPRTCYTSSNNVAFVGLTDSFSGEEQCGWPRTMREHRKYWQLFELSDD